MQIIYDKLTAVRMLVPHAAGLAVEPTMLQGSACLLLSKCGTEPSLHRLPLSGCRMKWSGWPEDTAENHC